MTNLKSDDLVKRLRARTQWISKGQVRLPQADELCDEAADRIEALEAAWPIVAQATNRIKELEAATAQPSEREAAVVRAARELVDHSDGYLSYADLAKAVAAYDTPAVISEPTAPHDERQQVPPDVV